MITREKAQLIIDMPKSCSECQLRYDITDYDYDDNGCDCCESTIWETNRETCPFVYDLNDFIYGESFEEELWSGATQGIHPQCQLQSPPTNTEFEEALENLVGYTGWEPTTQGQAEIQELHNTIKSHITQMQQENEEHKKKSENNYGLFTHMQATAQEHLDTITQLKTLLDEIKANDFEEFLVYLVTVRKAKELYNIIKQVKEQCK